MHAFRPTFSLVMVADLDDLAVTAKECQAHCCEHSNWCLAAIFQHGPAREHWTPSPTPASTTERPGRRRSIGDPLLPAVGDELTAREAMARCNLLSDEATLLAAGVDMAALSCAPNDASDAGPYMYHFDNSECPYATEEPWQGETATEGPSDNDGRSCCSTFDNRLGGQPECNLNVSWRRNCEKSRISLGNGAEAGDWTFEYVGHSLQQGRDEVYVNANSNEGINTCDDNGLDFQLELDFSALTFLDVRGHCPNTSTPTCQVAAVMADRARTLARVHAPDPAVSYFYEFPSHPRTTLAPTPAPTVIDAGLATVSSIATCLADCVDGCSPCSTPTADLLTEAADAISMVVAAALTLNQTDSDDADLVVQVFANVTALLTNITLLGAARLDEHVVSQGTSANGLVILVSVHSTPGSTPVSFPFFAPGFKGAASCLAAGAEPPCLAPAADGAAPAAGRTMDLPSLSAIGMIGDAFVGCHWLPNPFSNASSDGWVVSSDILSVTVGSVPHNTPFSSGASMNFSLTVPTNTTFGTGDPCVFWHEQSQAWSTTGCEHLGTTDGTEKTVKCACNHLTSFAILTDANTDASSSFGLSDAEEYTLSAFVYVCVGTSIVCLTVVILVYTTYAELRTQTKKILLHLCAVYNLSLVLFLTTAIGDFEGIACTSIGAALHFALLSTFVWMLVEGRHLHQTFVNVFSQHRADESRQLAVYCGVAYGVPALEVLLVVTLWPSAYERDDGFCFLSKEKGAIWFFYGPALAVIVLNIYVLVQVSREVWGLGVAAASGDSGTAEILSKAKRAFKSSLAFGSIMGVTWVVGLLSLAVPSSVAFHYIFAVFNALGGLWILGFHLLIDPEVGKKVRSSGLLTGSSSRKKKGRTKGQNVVRRQKGAVPTWGTSTMTSSSSSPDGTLQPSRAEMTETRLMRPEPEDAAMTMSKTGNGESGGSAMQAPSDRLAPGPMMSLPSDVPTPFAILSQTSFTEDVGSLETEVSRYDNSALFARQSLTSYNEDVGLLETEVSPPNNLAPPLRRSSIDEADADGLPIRGMTGQPDSVDDPDSGDGYIHTGDGYIRTLP